MLERAAQVATQRPAAYPGPHQYLYLRFREGWTEVENSIAFQTANTQQTWVAPDGSGRQRLTVDGPPRFLRRQDRAAWVAAGRPKLVPASTDGTYPAGGYPAGNQAAPSGLPTNPGELLPAIVKRFEGGRSSVEETFETAGTLLQDSGSPALRAALYRMLAVLHYFAYLDRASSTPKRISPVAGMCRSTGAGAERTRGSADEHADRHHDHAATRDHQQRVAERTCRKRHRTQAITNSSIETTEPATTSAVWWSGGICRTCAADG